MPITSSDNHSIDRIGGRTLVGHERRFFLAVSSFTFLLQGVLTGTGCKIVFSEDVTIPFGGNALVGRIELKVVEDVYL